MRGHSRRSCVAGSKRLGQVSGGCVAGDVRWEQLYNWDMSWDRHGEAM